jgi:hypothetical protein
MDCVHPWKEIHIFTDQGGYYAGAYCWLCDRILEGGGEYSGWSRTGVRSDGIRHDPQQAARYGAWDAIHKKQRTIY